MSTTQEWGEIRVGTGSNEPEINLGDLSQKF